MYDLEFVEYRRLSNSDLRGPPLSTGVYRRGTLSYSFVLSPADTLDTNRTRVRRDLNARSTLGNYARVTLHATVVH